MQNFLVGLYEFYKKYKLYLLLFLLAFPIFIYKIAFFNLYSDLIPTIVYTALLTITSIYSVKTYFKINFSIDFIICVLIIIIYPEPVAMIALPISITLANVFFTGKPLGRIIFNFSSDVINIYLVYFVKHYVEGINLPLKVILLTFVFITINTCLLTLVVKVESLDKEIFTYFWSFYKYYSKTFLPAVVIVTIFTDLYFKLNQIYFLVLFILILYLLQMFLEYKMSSFENKRFYNSLMNNTNFGIVLFDNNNLIKNYNKKADQILYKMDLSSKSNKALADIFGEECFNNINHSSSAQLPNATFTYKLSNALIEINSTLLFDNYSNLIGTLLILEDVTEKFAVEEKTRLLDKLAIAGELSASVAHEVRNPLQSIKGFVQLMHERHLKGKEDEFVKIVSDDIDRIAYVLSEFIGLAKPLRFDITDADISKIMQEAMLLEEPNALMNDITFNKEISSVPIIKADEEKLKQVFLNIIHNAVQASNANSYINITIKHLNGNIVVIIQDHGIGMDEYHVKRIFEPFYTTKKDGSGLGLAVAYRFITQVKGSIDVQSEYSKGTTFTITIPAVS